jgi:hypothetical protein
MKLMTFEGAIPQSPPARWLTRRIIFCLEPLVPGEIRDVHCLVRAHSSLSYQSFPVTIILFLLEHKVLYQGVDR